MGNGIAAAPSARRATNEHSQSFHQAAHPRLMQYGAGAHVHALSDSKNGVGK